jgi:hypothetical protein
MKGEVTITLEDYKFYTDFYDNLNNGKKMFVTELGYGNTRHRFYINPNEEIKTIVAINSIIVKYNSELEKENTDLKLQLVKGNKKRFFSWL